MKKKKLRQFQVFKVSTERFVKYSGDKIKIVPLKLSKREALENGEIVKIQSNQLTNKILDHFYNCDVPYAGLDFTEIIVNLTVPTDDKKRGEKEYATLAKTGITLNGKKYVRLFSGSGQIRRNTITFIRDDLYAPIFNSLLCGLTLDDFGKDFNAAKFNAYGGLNMSGCHLLPPDYAPKVCIVDDFEQIRPCHIVNHVTEERVKYITLADGDYILRNGDPRFTIEDGKAIRDDGVEFIIRNGIKKHIEEKPYNEIDDSPCLNSFDGQGLMCPEWAQKVSNYLGLDYCVSEMIIRAPWVKGLLVNVPFHEYFYQHGITEIIDSFGKVRKLDDIDAIISLSQFKMAKVYRAKCEKLKCNAWDYHQKAMQENHLLWGVAKINRASDDDVKALNYQYLQALTLEKNDIDALCKPTEDFLRSLNSGDLDAVYRNLIVGGKGYFSDDTDYDSGSEDNNDYKKLFQRVIEANPGFINDKYIRAQILKECRKKFDDSKLGKILIHGNFQFCVSDPIAQLEWIAKNHCGLDIDVVGVVPEAHVYSNYWLNDLDTKQIVLMRSPLIDRNEISKRKLIQEHQHYFRYLASGIVLSIHDLTALQCGGCDFDGDILFSTNDPVIARGCLDYTQAKPLYYALTSTDLVGKINAINLIKADVRGLNSAVGSISNRAGSLYAMLENYDKDSAEYKKLYDSIIALGQIVGMEIDRIKTAVAPTFPLEWTALQGIKLQSMDSSEIITNPEEEQQGIFYHNLFVPDRKPYYFRHNYDYINRALNTIVKDFDTVSKINYGMPFDKLDDRVKKGSASDEQKKFVEEYHRVFPVIDTACIVNYISHKFEQFEKDLKRESIAEGKNMLQDITCDICFDPEITSKFKKEIQSYARFRRFMALRISGDDNNQQSKRKKAYEAQTLMRMYFREKLSDIVGGDLQAVFAYLIHSGADENTVFEILDEFVLPMIEVER